MAEADNAAYPNETNRLGKVVILSKYPDIKIAYKAVSGGFRKAKENTADSKLRDLLAFSLSLYLDKVYKNVNIMLLY